MKLVTAFATPAAFVTTLLSCLYWDSRIGHWHDPVPLNLALGMTTAAIMSWTVIALICAERGGTL